MNDHEFISLILQINIPTYIKHILILQVIYKFLNRTFPNHLITYNEFPNNEYVYLELQNYRIEIINSNLVIINMNTNTIKETIDLPYKGSLEKDHSWKIQLDKLIGRI